MVSGVVKPLEPKGRRYKIPHMGWNNLDLTKPHPVLPPVNDLHAYFVHSFHMVPEEDAHTLATSDHGEKFCAIVGRDNIIGTQFHPEKSQRYGLQLLANFLKWDGQL